MEQGGLAQLQEAILSEVERKHSSEQEVFFVNGYMKYKRSLFPAVRRGAQTDSSRNCFKKATYILLLGLRAKERTSIE